MAATLSTAPRPDARVDWRLAAVLAAACGAILGFHLGAPALFDPDEGRIAEVAREMVKFGDWITPHYDFIPYLDKPVLFHWLVAVAFKIAGISALAARLPSIVAAIGSLLIVWDVGRARFGEAGARWSALIFASSPIVAAFARASIFDMTLTCFVAAAIWAWWRGGMVQNAKARTPWLIASAAAMAGATLIKGPIGTALPVAVLLASATSSRAWPRWTRGQGLTAVAVWLIVVAPWYLLAESRNPGYLRYFLVDEHLGRYFTAKFRRGEPWYYYGGVLMAGLGAWTVLVPLVLSRARQTWQDGTGRLLIIWALTPVVVFSLSASKQPGYILPSLPPLAVLLGEVVARRLSSRSLRDRWPLALAPAVTLAIVVYAGLVVAQPSWMPFRLAAASVESVAQVRAAFSPLMLAVMVLPCAGIASVLWAGARACFVIASATAAALYVVAVIVLCPVAERRSARSIADASSSIVQPDDQLVFYDAHFSSLPFYLAIERPVWHVWSHATGEPIGSPYIAAMKPPPVIGAGPVIFSGTEFGPLWRRAPGRLLVYLEEGRLDQLSREIGASPRVLVRINGAVLVTNR